MKVNTSQPLNTGDSLVKVGSRRVRIVMDRFTRSKDLTWLSPKLYGELDWRGVNKKIRGDFGIFILKKKRAGKWPRLEMAEGLGREETEEERVKKKMVSRRITQEGERYDLQNVGASRAFRISYYIIYCVISY